MGRRHIPPSRLYMGRFYDILYPFHLLYIHWKYHWNIPSFLCTEVSVKYPHPSCLYMARIPDISPLPFMYGKCPWHISSTFIHGKCHWVIPSAVYAWEVSLTYTSSHFFIGSVRETVRYHPLHTREVSCLWHTPLKGTVLPDYKCLEVISIKSSLLGHVTPDIKNFLNSSFNF